jgi:GT2 family glycosyltransferase
VLPTSSHSCDSDFARTLSRKFEHGRFLIIGNDPLKLGSQFAEEKREAAIWSHNELVSKLSHGAGAARFETAVWFYPSGQNDDSRIVEALAGCADGIVLLPGLGADVATRRPHLVECFGRYGFVPDYECDLTELDSGALCLRPPPRKAEAELVSAVETTFARLNSQLDALRRALDARTSELAAADRHIATIEEKLLKVKQYHRELKLLKEQKQALRKSPERRIGQILLAPYRLPEKLLRQILKRIRGGVKSTRTAVPVSAYQKWLQEHCASPEQIQMMRDTWHGFTSQPLISILTPVFNTPVPWLREAVDSVLAQAYGNWELVLIDDGSTAPDLMNALPGLASRDRRIRLVRLEAHQGISAALNRGLDVASGEWITFVDHDDMLEPDALFQNVRLLQENPNVDLIYSDEDKLTEQGFDSPMLKPDWSPDFFLSNNYLCHLIFLRRQLIHDVGGFRSDFDGSQDYDLLLRIIERSNRIVHIPRILYHWRRSENSSASNVRQKPGQLDASRRAIEEHLKRGGQHARVTIDWPTHAFCVRRDLPEAKKISIIIRRGDHAERIKRCIESLTAGTSYPNYEIVVVQQESESFSHSLCRVVHAPEASSAVELSNFAVQQTDSPWLLFLDAGIEPIPQSRDWLTIMAEHVQRPEVGAVGPRLVNPNGTIEHAGIIFGVDGIAQPAFHGFPGEHPGVNRQLRMTRNYSAVSGACMLVRREVFEEIEGFDETLSLGFADIDLCLKMRRAGYLIVYTPLAKLYWDASVRDKIDTNGEAIMRQRWSDVLERDPYYNPNFSREHADFSLGK